MAKKPQQKEKGKPIKGINATRDVNSGAVVFNDQADYQRAQKRKRAGRRLVQQETKTKNLEKQVQSLETQLADALARIETLENA